MPTILHIEASPRKDRSRSTRVASAFLEAFLAQHPEYTQETIDPWTIPLLEFNGPAIDAKYGVLHGHQPSDVRALATWEEIKKTAEPLFAAEKIVLSVPMWNFGIPYKLKHFIDVITQPTITFTFSPETGYVGLVPDKPTLVIYARGGVYPPNSPAERLDHQRPYLRQWLQFIGIQRISEIVIEPTLGVQDKIRDAEHTALAEALALVNHF